MFTVFWGIANKKLDFHRSFLGENIKTLFSRLFFGERKYIFFTFTTVFEGRENKTIFPDHSRGWGNKTFFPNRNDRLPFHFPIGMVSYRYIKGLWFLEIINL